MYYLGPFTAAFFSGGDQPQGRAMGNNTDHDTVELRGSSISYFTGKMENYFRLKGIPYRLESMVFPEEEERNKKVLGISQCQQSSYLMAGG